VQKHWITDVISGLLFGPALFLGYALAVVILAGRWPATPQPRGATSTPLSATPQPVPPR
jgi:hypothetical protein